MTAVDDTIARWADAEDPTGPERSHASTAALQALDVAQVGMELGSATAEATIRRIGRHFRRLGRRSGLLAFEAWGIQLASAPREELAEQARAAVTGLRRVLALPRRLPTLSPRAVLLVEADAAAGRRLETALTAPQRRVLRARTPREAWTVCRTDVVDVLILDLEATGDEGRDLLVRLRERMDRTCTIVFLPPDDAAAQAESFALGADLCFAKPVHAPLVATAVAGQLDRLTRADEVAIRDVLTGLTNRAGFEEAHKRAVAHAARYDEDVSVALLDLDRFKEVNDEYGHATGDRVLLGVATVLEERFRDGDLVARWGGEEFAVLMPRTDPAGAKRAVEAVLERLSERTFRDSKGRALPPVTFSAGVAAGGDRPDAAMADADRRLYRAKQRGRARVEGPEGD